jgi:hypothetical protein
MLHKESQIWIYETIHNLQEISPDSYYAIFMLSGSHTKWHVQNFIILQNDFTSQGHSIGWNDRLVIYTLPAVSWRLLKYDLLCIYSAKGMR